MSGKLRHVQREGNLRAIATRQHGVVSHRQLLELGCGVRWIERRLAEERFEAVHREVYSIGYSRLSRKGRWWAAVLAYGSGTVLSHHSAAVLWGLRRSQAGAIHVNASLGWQGIGRRRGIYLHRCQLRPEETTIHDGLPVTTIGRTLFDFAEAAPYGDLKKTTEAADRRNLLQLRELEEICERGRGRRALKPVRRLIAELAPPDEGRSPLEIRFAAFVREHRLPAPFQNVDVLGHEVDALWPADRLIVELDSWEHHGHRAAFERDRARDSKLLIAGYRSIRITHRRLDREAEQLAAEIRQLLALSQPPA